MSKNSRKTQRRYDSDDNDSLEVNTKRRKLSDSMEENVDQETVNVSGEIRMAKLESISDQLLSLESKLAEELGKITFRLPIEYIYSPLEYAFNIHSMYVQKYCNTHKKILFLGMNPGPWGMSQTGVPFGEIKMVRDWLRISGPVGKPSKEQPNRKVTGFECTRSEVSGKRLWGLFQELCGTPEKFFEHSYIHNYCPIALMDKKGRNITPAEIKGSEIQTLHSACDKALAETIKILKVEIVVGVGLYAEKRAQFVVNSYKLPAKVLCLPHPSPRAANNKNWNDKATKKLDELGLLDYFKV